MKIFYSFLFLLLTSIVVHAQEGIVRGNVYDKETGDPIIYGTVQLVGTTMGANTDINGFFTIADVPAGDYQLQASYIGYDSTAVVIKVTNNSIVYKSLYITEAATTLGTVQVSAQKAAARADVQVSKVTVTPKQIRSLPSTGGEADIAQYLPVLPGIIVTGDQGGQLYIRGGSPIQNKILLDGMTIYNPFHSIGFFSVFETEAIKSVDVLTGGFNAEYGGRISAIVDIKTREGNRKRYGGVVSASPFQSKVLLEGPMKKLAEDGKGGSSSFLLTAKHSYLEQTSKAIYQYEPIDSSGLPYGFTDLYGKMSFLSENGSKVNFFGFNFNDRVNFEGIADLGWKTTGAGTNFTLVPPASNVVLNGTLAFSRYDIELDEGDGNPRTSGITDYSANLNFTYFGNNNQVNYGFRFTGINTDFRFRNFLGVTISQEDFTTELAGYLKYKHTIGRLILQPSLRVQFYASQSQISVEPRLGAKFNATDFLRFKLAGGLYSQNLVSSVNERDIVNLFVGFLSGPEETIFEPGTRNPTEDRLQKSTHGIFGVEVDLTPQITANVEGYYKDFRQLINLNRSKLSEQDPNFATETGDAYGVDFSLKYENRDLYLWGTYSLGYVNRFDGEQTYPTVFDRRHNVNLLGTYTFGEDKSWETSLRWNFGTGFPFTQTQAFYTLYNYQNGIDTDVLGGNPDTPAEGGLGILFADDRNGGRLPTYHRMDASVKKRIDFSKYVNLEIVASVTNVYNRPNIFFFDRVEYERVNQLPILPSLSFKLSF